MKTLKTIIVLILFTALSFNMNAQDFKKTLKMEGRVMYDFNFLSDGDDYNLAGNEFRRMRLAVKGKLTPSVSYLVDLDLTANKIAYRSVYVKFAAPDKIGSLTVGSFSEPTGLDMMTSSKYITFQERAMMFATQGGKYGAGFRYDNYKLLDEKMSLQLAYTFNGTPIDTNIEGGANFIGRVTGKVIENKDKNQLVHLGINYELRNNDVDSYNMGKFRFENHMGDKFNTPTIGDATDQFKNTSDLGFEVATVLGPLSIQGEYELASVKTENETYKSAGYYGYVSYFITGESRAYKKGAFSRVKVKNNFSFKDKTYGAVELVARYSVMDFNGYDVDDTSNDNIAISNITAGLNWYLNPNTRIMYNYVNGEFNDINQFGTDGEKLTGHLVRFQIDF
ncbi:MAG: porin [Flavobacteriaceae bacterium]